jgi:hypothetical protein
VRLHHFFHVYADGNWAEPVTEHCDALVRFGLFDALSSWHVGFVGTQANVGAARATLDALAPGYTVAGWAETGWEQETLEPLWKWCRRHSGAVLYCHTKGASRSDPIDRPWRRCMTYEVVVNWQRPVAALEAGAKVAGSYWHTAAESIAGPEYGVSGMFGGNFWWARCDAIRQNCRPGRENRFEAEHWLGQLSEVTPLVYGTDLIDLNCGSVATGTEAW